MPNERGTYCFWNPKLGCCFKLICCHHEKSDQNRCKILHFHGILQWKWLERTYGNTVMESQSNCSSENNATIGQRIQWHDECFSHPSWFETLEHYAAFSKLIWEDFSNEQRTEKALFTRSWFDKWTIRNQNCRFWFFKEA